MAIIPRKLSTELVREPTWEPFELMRNMLRYDPFREMELFRPVENVWVPEFEVKEIKGAYLFKADVPGMKEEDLELSITGNRLSIGGKREEEKREEGEKYYAYERSYGTFTRIFTLPEGVDVEHIVAELKDGVLTVNLPKRPEVLPKKIELKTGKTVRA